jgi:hypothetical protein
MEYISLEELSSTYGVSISTARRTYKTLRDSSISVFEGVDIIKKQPLPTGKFKVFLLKKYLDSQLSKSTVQPTTQSTVHSTSQVEQLNGKALELLEEQLRKKDQQIEEYQENFKHFQELENKIIDHVESLRAELREQTYLLEQKNTEIRQLQGIAQHRQTLLEQYTAKQNKSQEKPQKQADYNYTEVEEVEEVDLSQVSTEPKKQKESKDFMAWLNTMK